MRKKLTTCTNCEQKFAEDFQFCPHCGQRSNEDLTLSVLFYNTISNYFSVDARFFKSFIPLMIKPGYLAERFIQGKRLLYLHPAQMYLFISVVFFFFFSFISRTQVENVNKVFKEDIKAIKTLDTINIEEFNNKLKNIEGFEIKGMDALDAMATSEKQKELNSVSAFDFVHKKEIDSLIKLNASKEDIYRAMGMNDDAGYITRKFYSQMLKFYTQRDGGSLLQAFYDSIPIAMFILLPIFALILKLLYFKRGRFPHHLVFSFYFFSFLFMAFSLLMIADFIFKLPSFVIAIVILSTFLYLLLALKRFYRQGWFLSFFKTSVATFTFLLFVIPFAIVIVGLATFMFY